MLLKSGKYRGDKILYPDGISCCIWIPFDTDDESDGIAFDFPYDSIDDVMGLLQMMKEIEPEVFIDKE